ncbi:N-acetyltransferase [Micromonospora sp. NPDC048170]|uniref:N-acetyltransferase n=1 Tax=Micromonospora sp. NPDC048170 TaxID=3154819 RepID=UPI003410D922
MTHHIRAARWTEQDPVAAVIAGALQPTPLAAWLVPDEEQRGRVLTDVARIWVEHALFFGDVYVAAGRATDLAAAAVGFHRLGPIPPPRKYTTRLATAAGPHAERFLALDDIIGSRQPAYAHYYLACLAVLPTHQRAGRGRALLAHLRSRTDLLDLPSWTVTLPAGQHLLARSGYDTTQATAQVSTGVIVHAMSRDQHKRSGTPSPSARLADAPTPLPPVCPVSPPATGQPAPTPDVTTPGMTTASDPSPVLTTVAQATGDRPTQPGPPPADVEENHESL